MRPLFALPAPGTESQFRVVEWFASFRRTSLLYRITYILLALPLLLPLAYVLGVFVWRLTSNPILYEIFFPIFHKTLIVQLLVEAACIAYIALAAREERYRPYVTVAHALLVGLGCILVLTSLISADANASFFGHPLRGDGVLFLLHLGVYIFLLSWVVRDRRSLEALFAVAIAAGLAAFVAIAPTIFVFTPARVFDRAEWYLLLEGMLGNPSFFGHYFLLLLFFSAHFVLQRPGLRRMVVPAVLCVGISFALSNTAMVIAGVVCLLLLAFIARWVFFGVLLAGLSVAVVLAATGDALLRRWQSLLDSMDIRFLLWRDALRALVNGKPWLGHGWGNNDLAWGFAPSDSIAQSSDASSHFLADRMHNILLEWWSAAGIVGLLAMLSVVGYFCWRSFRIFRERREVGALFFVGAFAFQFLYLLLNFDTLMSYVLMGILIAGFVVLNGGRAYAFHPPRALWYAVAFPVAAAMVVLAVVANILPFHASYLKTRADVRIAQAPSYVRPQAAATLGDLERALAVRQPYRSLQRDIASSFYKLADTVPLSREEHDRVRRALTTIYEELAAQSPMSANAHHNLALIAFKFSKDPQGAERHLADAIRLAPANGLLRYQLGALTFNDGDDAAAERVFSELLRDGIYDGPAHLYLGFLDLKAGRLREGRKNVAMALRTYHPREAEWQMLESSFLIHGSKHELLAWYPRLMGLLQNPDGVLRKKTVLLAQELGRQDIAQRYANDQ